MTKTGWTALSLSSSSNTFSVVPSWCSESFSNVEAEGIVPDFHENACGRERVVEEEL